MESIKKFCWSIAAVAAVLALGTTILGFAIHSETINTLLDDCFLALGASGAGLVVCDILELTE